MNKTKLKQNVEKIRTTEKKEKRREPPRGDGEWARKSLLEFLFYYTRLQLDRKYHLVLIQDEPKGLQNCPKVNTKGGDTLGELRMAQKSVFGQQLLLFLDGPTKNQKAIKPKGCSKTL